MTRILEDYRLSEYGEVFILIILGMISQTVDGSPFSIKSRWKSVWEMEIPKEFFSVFAQHFIKSVLSLIVVARCSTTYLYVLSSILVIACISTNGSPKLLLPWLLTAGIKSIGFTLLETIIGVYVCSSFKRIEVACIEFIIQKAVEMMFSSFLWVSILNIHNTMRAAAPPEPTQCQEPITQESVKRADLKRRRARSLVDESTLHKTARLNYFEFKDVPKMLLQMMKKEEELSQDSLLAQGMMLASVSNMGSFDHLKTSQSLGELGSIDLKSLQVVGLEENNEPPTEKALKFMKLTWDDINKAKRKRRRTLNDLHYIDDSVWEEVSKKGGIINRPKQTRPEEVFVRDFRRDEEPVKTGRRRRTRSKSLDSRAKGTDDEDENGEDDDESMQVSMSEAEENLSRYILMSNLKEEDKVFRIRLESSVQIRRAHKYADLYRQQYMSVIGPEVFDNACKLKPLHYDKREEEEETLQNVIERDDEGEQSKKKKKTIYFRDEIEEIASSGSWVSERSTPETSNSSKEVESEFGEPSFKTEERESEENLTVVQLDEEIKFDENVEECVGFESEDDDSMKTVSLIFKEGACRDRKSGSSNKENETIFIQDVEERDPGALEFLNEMLANLDDDNREHNHNDNHSHPTTSKESNPANRETKRNVSSTSNADKKSENSSRKINLVKTKTAPEERNSSEDDEKKIKIIITRDSNDKDAKFSQNKQIYFLTEIVKKPVSTVLKTLYDSKSPWKSSAVKNAEECLKISSYGNRSSFDPCAKESLCSIKSDESFSLYYSKTADLASPIFNVRRFIYPDRIHYSYQNMRESGFDIEINGLPLIIRDSLTFNPYAAAKAPDVPESNLKITKRPMDLSFASDNDLMMERELTTESLDDDADAFEECIEVPEDKAKRIYDKLLKIQSRATYNVLNKFLKMCVKKHKGRRGVNIQFKKNI